MTENDNTLSSSIEHATSDMTGPQRERYVAWLKENMPEFLASGKEEVFKSGATAQEEKLFAQYRKDTETIKQGDYRALDALKKKYRRRGLEIW